MAHQTHESFKRELEQLIAPDARQISPAAAPHQRYLQQLVERAWKHLVDWACPVNTAAAILITPYLETGGLAPAAWPAAQRDAYALAQRYQNWKRQTLPVPAGRVQEAPAQMQRLQKLFIASYEDEAIPFLAIAEGISQLDLLEEQSPEARQAILRDTEAALLPILERYGLWELNRYAADRLFEYNGAARRAAVLALLRAGDERRRRVLDEAERRLLPLLPAGASLTLHPVRPSRLFLRSLAYEATYGKEDAQEMIQRETARLIIDVTVPSQEACYLALGAVHHLWRPVGNYIKDLIGAPKFNGYQAIHSVVSVNPAPDFAAEVEFYISSAAMQQFNAWGRIAELRQHGPAAPPADPPPSSAWWHRAAAGRGLVEQLAVGNYSAPTYVFSPLGEIYQLPQQATPLDYAFAVHSNFGHAYAGALVNGLAVDPDFILANGDIVSIQTAAHEKARSRASWLGHARSDLTAKHLRREFSRQMRHNQHGRELIQTALKEWCGRYNISFSEVREESYLLQTAKRWSLSDLETFYDAVAGGRIEPETVASHIISQEIGHRIGDHHGAPLGLRPGRINIAHCCRPTADDAIVGRFTQAGTKHERVKIHRADCPQIDGADVRPLSWRKVNHQGLYEYVANGFDRERVLSDVLQPFYMNGAYLHKVNAERLRDESAQFFFLAELPDADAAQLIQKSVAGVADISECTMRPLTLSPQEVFTRKRKLTYVNPFHYNVPASSRFEFVGRQMELAELKQLFAIGSPFNHIVIYGPWKVGKTSLLQYIASHDRVEFGAVAVMVDCHNIPDLSLPALLDEMMRAIAHRLAPEMDVLGSYQIALGEDDHRLLLENPLLGFRRFLQRIRPLLGDKRRLVILIDEFSDLFDDVKRNRLERSIFRNLRGLFEQEKEVIFLTVIQTAAIHEMRAHDGLATELLEGARLIPLGPLDDESIHELLQKKLRLLNLRCDEATVRRVMTEIGGNPYVANVLCYAVVEHLQETGETAIGPKHIDSAIDDILDGHGAIYFEHLTQLLGGPTESRLFNALATDAAAGWISARDLAAGAPINDLARLPEIEGALGRLQNKGLLAEKLTAADEIQYRIQIPLLARWLRESEFSHPAEG